MTNTPDQTPDPSITAPPVVDSQTGPEAPKPAKKAPAKKAAAKKTAATPEPAESARKDGRNLYLPALPEGFDYTGITATGPNGETINIAPAAGADAAAGSATLSFEGAGLKRDAQYVDMKGAIAAGSKAAKAMAKIAQREADLAREREQALDL
jgi:RNA polymerase primary sigma factor